MITCRDVEFFYERERPVLQGVSIDVLPGTTGLLGVNGAGKSTLLNVLAGGLRPRSGTVELHGVDLYGRRRSDLLRRIALMPQELQVPYSVRVRDAARFIAWARGVEPRETAARADDALALVGLTDRADERLSKLSGGMRRRFALAQALVAEPDVLLLDEPTTGLDPQQRVVLRDLVADLPPTATVVLSSHVIEDIEACCDQVVVLHEGAVLFHGSVDELRHRDRDGSAEAAFLALVMRGSRE